MATYTQLNPGKKKSGEYVNTQYNQPWVSSGTLWSSPPPKHSRSCLKLPYCLHSRPRTHGSRLSKNLGIFGRIQSSSDPGLILPPWSRRIISGAATQLWAASRRNSGRTNAQLGASPGAIPGCRPWVPSLGATSERIPGRDPWVPSLGAIPGCHPWVSSLGVIPGRRPWAPSLGAVPG